MINVQHQAPGAWDLTLDPHTPEEIKDLSARFNARLIVTPAWVDGRSVGVASLIDIALYSGVLYEREKGRLDWHGHGLPILLGDDHGLGNTWGTSFSVGSRPMYDGSNTSWIRDNVLRVGSGGAGGITVGTIASSAGSPKTGKITAGDTQRKVLGWVCRVYSKEWRINPDATLDVAAEATLWPSASASDATKVKAVAKGGDHEGLPAVALEAADDWRDYTTDVTANGQGATGSDSITSPYVDLDGDPIIKRRVVSASNADTASDCDTIAAQQLGRFDQPNTAVELTTSRHEITGAAQPGDTILAYDPDQDLYDLTKKVAYEGRQLPMIAIRVMGHRQPMREEWGKYLYSWNGAAFELHDLTPYVVAEAGATVLEVGAPKRRRGITPVSI